jgi:hypothetical protein
MSQVNNTPKSSSFKLSDTFAVIIPFFVILALGFINPIITIVLFIAWGVLTYMRGVTVTNFKTGEQETMHDIASAAFGMKHQAKDAIVGIKHISLLAADEFNHQQEMRDIKLEVLGTTMAEQDTKLNEDRAIKAGAHTAKREERKAVNKAKADEDRATYLHN